jgi:hypothetical protein
MDTTRRFPRSCIEAFPKDHAAAIEIHRKPKEPLGWIVVRWLSVSLLFCLLCAIALDFL